MKNAMIHRLILVATMVATVTNAAQALLPTVGGTWNVELNCKGYRAGVIEKFKSQDSFVFSMVSANEVSVVGDSASYSGRVLARPDKPGQGVLVLYNTDINESLSAAQNAAIYLDLKLKPDGTGSMKGTALLMGPAPYADQCKIKLSRE